jgi:hypothetical protein
MIISISEKSNRVQNIYGFRQNSSEHIQRCLRLYIDAVQTVSIVLQMDLHLCLTCTLLSPCLYPRASRRTYLWCFSPLVPKFLPLFQTLFGWFRQCSYPVQTLFRNRSYLICYAPIIKRRSRPLKSTHALYFVISYSLQRKDETQWIALLPLL